MQESQRVPNQSSHTISYLETNSLIEPHLTPPHTNLPSSMIKSRDPNFEEEPSSGQEDLQEDVENNSWIAPGYDPMNLCLELIEEVNGRTAQIDQASLYIDSPGVIAWQGVSKNENYITAQNDLPIDDAVRAIEEQLARLPHYDQKSLYIVALGPGDAKTEVALVKKILRNTSIKNICLDLLDISQPMLTATYKQVKRALSQEKGVIVTPCYGDFYKLHRYHRILNAARQENRLCVVTMFGYTFGNLKNERRWLLTDLDALPKHTLLVMDVVLGFAPASQPQEIMKKDPWLSGESAWQEPLENWILGPIRNHRRGIKVNTPIQVHAELDFSHCAISNSYCIELWATIPNQLRASLLFFKRYDTNALLDDMEKDGWLGIDSWPFGSNNQLLTLLRKET